MFQTDLKKTSKRWYLGRYEQKNDFFYLNDLNSFPFSKIDSPKCFKKTYFSFFKNRFCEMIFKKTMFRQNTCFFSKCWYLRLFSFVDISAKHVLCKVIPKIVIFLEILIFTKISAKTDCFKVISKKLRIVDM